MDALQESLYLLAFALHKNGERKEKGEIVNGAKSGVWNGWDEKGNLKYKGGYLNGKEDGKWVGYHANGKTKYEGVYKEGNQVGTWKYYNKKGKITTEEKYNAEGKVVKSKDFKQLHTLMFLMYFSQFYIFTCPINILF